MPKKIELKTKENTSNVSAFLNSISDPDKRKDAKSINTLMQKITGTKAKMWGSSIVGYGSYEYKRSNGDYGEFMRAGFSPRKNNFSLYVMPGYNFDDSLLGKLGPHKTGKSCLYIKKLDDVHLPTLKKIITAGWKEMKKLYPK